jgi:hypothetical protein
MANANETFRAVETREKCEGMIHVNGGGVLCGSVLHQSASEARACPNGSAVMDSLVQVRYTRRVWIHVNGCGRRCGATHGSEAERDACEKHPREAKS